MTIKATPYFEERAKINHPEANHMDWIERILANPESKGVQPDGRTRLWGFVPETRKWMRVIMEADGQTVHNAFYDRGHKVNA